jgi:hypothetical protein
VLWDLDVKSWVKRLCRIANRNLTFAEWQQYMGGDFRYHRTCFQLPDGEGVPQSSTGISTKSELAPH